MRAQKIVVNCVLLAVVLPMASQVARAQEKDAKTSWNPFKLASFEKSEPVASSSDVRKSSFFSDAKEDKPLFSMPKLTWSKQELNPKPKGEGTMSKLGKTSKKWWNNTVSFLNPFDKPKPLPQQGYQPQNAKAKSGGGAFGWLWREETIETPTNVNEFLSQERPRF